MLQRIKDKVAIYLVEFFLKISFSAKWKQTTIAVPSSTQITRWSSAVTEEEPRSNATKLGIRLWERFTSSFTGRHNTASPRSVNRRNNGNHSTTVSPKTDEIEDHGDAKTPKKNKGGGQI